MKPEQEVQAPSSRKPSQQPEQLTKVLTSVDESPIDKKAPLNLAPLWRTIKRNALLIASITIGTSIAGTYFVIATSPTTYKGQFQLLVGPVTAQQAYTDPSVISRDGSASASGGSEVDYDTLLQVLQSPGMLSRVAKEVQTRYPEVTYDSLMLAEQQGRLVVDRVEVQKVNPTKLIEVSYEGENPQEVQFIIEKFASEYLKYGLQDRKNHIGQGVKFIEEQLPSVQRKVNVLEEQLQLLKQRYRLSEPQNDNLEIARQYQTAKDQRINTQRELQEQKVLYANLEKQLQLAPDQVMAASSLSQDPSYQNLLSEKKKIESQIAIDSARFNENSPMIQTLREQEKNISTLLGQQGQATAGTQAANPKVATYQSSLRQQLIGQMVTTANQIKVLEVRDESLAQTEAALAQQLKQFPVVQRQYNTLVNQLDIATKTLNQLLMQREALRVDDAQKQLPWELVSDPGVPRDANGAPLPNDKKITKNIIMIGLASLLLGLGVALLKERYQNIFHTSEDLIDGTELPLLGAIPYYADSAKQLRPYKVLEETGLDSTEAFLFREAFISLYTSIRFLEFEPAVRSLVVSSAMPADGKTTVALYLAQTAAAMGQRVLLVDANLRAPQVHVRLGLPNEQGLSELLEQDNHFKEIIRHSRLEDNLYVLTAGKLYSDSIRKLASYRMQELMAEFEAQFDMVIYDTPHLGPTDANFLATNTDGILFVVGIGKTERSLVKDVISRLEALRLPVLGMVANHLREGRTGKFTHHAYYEQELQVRPHAQEQRKIVSSVAGVEDDIE